MRSFDTSNEETHQKIKWVIRLVLAVLGVTLLLILNPFTQVEAGTRGLVFNWGALQPHTLDQGIHWRTPVMQKIISVTTRPIEVDYKIEVGHDAAISKDNQSIGADLVVFYRYDDSRLVEMWSKFGEDRLKSLVSSAMKESLKDTLGSYTIFDVAEHQEKIRGEVYSKFVAKVKDYPVAVSDFRIQNYDWSDAFDAQINATMKAAQQVKQAEQELKLTEQEAQKKVKEAEADKTALVTQAEGQRDAARLAAEAKSLEGEGIKKYNLSVAANIDIEVRLRQLEIEMERAKRWNGQNVPDQVFSPIPFSSGFITK